MPRSLPTSSHSSPDGAAITLGSFGEELAFLLIYYETIFADYFANILAILLHYNIDMELVSQTDGNNSATLPEELEEIVSACESHRNSSPDKEEERYLLYSRQLQMWFKDNPELQEDSIKMMRVQLRTGYNPLAMKGIIGGLTFDENYALDYYVNNPLRKGRAQFTQLMKAVNSGDIDLNGDVLKTAIDHLRKMLILAQLSNVDCTLNQNGDVEAAKSEAATINTQLRNLEATQNSLAKSEGTVDTLEGYLVKIRQPQAENGERL